MHQSPRRQFLAFAMAGSLTVSACLGQDGEPPIEPEPVVPIEDGEWFAMVTVGTSEDQDRVLALDLADWLTGDDARGAAIEDGVIQPNEDLPNDFYIDNDETVYELLHLVASPDIRLISSHDSSQMIPVSAEEFAQLYEGTHPGKEGFYLAPLLPIPMTVTVADGVIAKALMVYVP